MCFAHVARLSNIITNIWLLVSSLSQLLVRSLSQLLVSSLSQLLSQVPALGKLASSINYPNSLNECANVLMILSVLQCASHQTLCLVIHYAEPQLL